MTIVPVEPNASSSGADPWSLTGAASRHLALSDDVDTSYVQCDANGGQFLSLTFATPTPPANSIFKAARLKTRDAALGSGLYQVGFRPHAFFPLFTAPVSVTHGTTPTTRQVLEYLQTDLGTPSQWKVELLGLFSSAGANVYELDLDVVYVVEPVTDVIAPTGTITDNNVPLVEWSNTLDSDGGAQTSFEVKIFNDAQYGAGGFSPDTSTPFSTSGIVASNSNSYSGEDQLPDDTYRAYVRVAQTVNGDRYWSDWDFIGFTIDVLLPGLPTLTATPDNISGLIALEATVTAGESGTTTDQIQFQISEDGGNTWSNARTGEGSGRVTPQGGSSEVNDHEASNGVERSYRARSIHDYGDGLEAFSEWTAVEVATWEDGNYRLKHPLDPSLNAVFTLFSFPGHSTEPRHTVHQPLGATEAVVVSTTRGPRSGTMAIRCDNGSDRAALDRLLAAATVPLLFQDQSGGDIGDIWMAIGSHSRSRLVDAAWYEKTREEVVWTEVSRPAGNLISP